MFVQPPDCSLEPLELASVEDRIILAFARRIRDFHLIFCHNGLVLEGRSRSYYCKQEVQQAVMNATPLPIVANNIQVETHDSPARLKG